MNLSIFEDKSFGVFIRNNKKKLEPFMSNQGNQRSLRSFFDGKKLANKKKSYTYLYNSLIFRVENIGIEPMTF